MLWPLKAKGWQPISAVKLSINPRPKQEATQQSFTGEAPYQTTGLPLIHKNKHQINQRFTKKVILIKKKALLKLNKT